MSDAEDRRLAKAWLIGFFEVDKRGHMRDAFFEKGSRQERDARSALANLFYRDALDPPLMRTLAKMFYPYITGPHLDGPPRDYPSRFEIVGRRKSNVIRYSQIAQFIADRLTDERGSVKRAIAAAAKKFKMSARTIERDIWGPRAKLLRPPKSTRVK